MLILAPMSLLMLVPVYSYANASANDRASVCSHACAPCTCLCPCAMPNAFAYAHDILPLAALNYSAGAYATLSTPMPMPLRMPTLLPVPMPPLCFPFALSMLVNEFSSLDGFVTCFANSYRLATVHLEHYLLAMVRVFFPCIN